MGTVNGVAYTELYEGTGQLDVQPQQKSTAQRMFKVAWGDRLNFLKAMLGGVSLVGGEIVITPCQIHPDVANMYATQGKYEPMGTPSGENSFASAKVTIKYETLTWNPSSPNPQDLYEEKLRTSYEILELSNEPVTHPGSAGPGVPAPPVEIVIPKIEYDLTLHRQPVIPFATIRNFMGSGSTKKPKVNSTTFRGAAPGHMLFLGCDADGKQSSFGNEVWEVTYKFLWSPYDHRADYDPTVDDWVTRNNIVTNQPKYEAADFNLLL